MAPNRRTLGFTIVELAVVMLVIVILLAAAVPVVAGAAGNAGVQQSMSNLVAQSAAHLLYAADWNGRQVTHNPDDPAPGELFFSGPPTAVPGTTFEFTFLDPGIYGYHCQPHESFGMISFVTVLPEPGSIALLAASVLIRKRRRP